MLAPMSTYPQINPRITPEQKAWLARYEAATGVKGTVLIKKMLEALIDSCGPKRYPKWPYDFRIQCLIEADKSTAAHPPQLGGKSETA